MKLSYSLMIVEVSFKDLSLAVVGARTTSVTVGTGNESLEFESRVESQVIDVEPSHFVQTTRIKSSPFLLRLKSTTVFPTFITSV